MKPILYACNSTDLTNNGIGVLECLSCVISESRNGEYELTATYPMSGRWFSSIANDCIIKAKANETSALQQFRIYHIEKPINGVITIHAEHISYRANHVPIAAFTAVGATHAMAALIAGTVIANSFTAWTDIVSDASFSIDYPVQLRTGVNAMLTTYGGELEWDNYNIKLHAARGADNGVTVVYGKNLIDLRQEENIADIITGVYPYWIKNSISVTLPEKVVTVANSYSYERVIPLDMTNNFQVQPTENQLRAAATEYVGRSGLTDPKVSLTVSFAQLWQTKGYEDVKELERVNLCDTVTIKFTRLGINRKAKVIKTNYDCLRERYESIDLGEEINSLVTQLFDQQQKIEDTNLDGITKYIDSATAAITGASGGYIVLRPSKKPGELLIMDTDNVGTTSKVWRFNLGGLGYSRNGVAGPYLTAMTQDGEIVADFIKTGNISSRDGKFIINLDAGTMMIKDGNDAIIFSFDASKILKVAGHIEAKSGAFGAFSADADGGLFGDKMLKVGGMTLTDTKILGMKITGDNMDLADCNPKQSGVAALGVDASGNLHVGSLYVGDAQGNPSSTLELWWDSPGGAAPTPNGTANVIQITDRGDGLTKRAQANTTSQSLGVCAKGEIYGYTNTVTDGGGYLWAYCVTRYSLLGGKYTGISVTPFYARQYSDGNAHKYFNMTTISI